MLRKELSPDHPVVGEGYRLLDDDDTLQAGDQTACVSMLFSRFGDTWISVDKEWKDDLGRTVGDILGPDSPDADANDRVFRRKVQTAKPLGVHTPHEERTMPKKKKNILTAGELADQIARLPRDMKVWVGVPQPGGGFSPCLLISHVSADPKGRPGLDDCGIVLDPTSTYSNR